MAYTQADLDALQAALASPEHRVRFSDGREVQYRSIGEIQQAIGTVTSDLAAAASSTPGVRQIKVNMEGGF